MTPKDIIIIGTSVAGFLVITVLGKRWGWYELIGGTNRLLREQNSILTEQNVTLKQELVESIKKNETNKEEFATKHEENVKALATMQGQIDVLKNVPLTDIGIALKSIDSTNKTILATLKSSAIVLAQNTKDATTAAKEVKSDLVESNK